MWDISEQNVLLLLSFGTEKKIFGFVSASKNLSVNVFSRKRKYFVVFSQAKENL